jgi:hypothetical protein
MSQNSLNLVAFNTVIDRLVQVILTNNPDQKYDPSDEMTTAASVLASDVARNLNSDVLNQVLVYRQNFEKAIKAKYRVRYVTGVAAATQDLQAEYNKKKVIQKTQVKSGFLDLLIGKLHMQSTNSIY